MSRPRLEPVSPGPRRFHHSDFGAAGLAARKADAGLDVSVVVPAHNEEATVAALVSVVRERLMEETDLVDELVVVDSDSTDDTARIARAAGARVLAQDEVLPAAGPGRGKGEALWKGLAASSGDLVVFVDADIHDFDERFVVGLLGPLLHPGDIEFVKATYDRPLLVDGETTAGGGRVTELMARPLLRCFWPPLAELGQPLAGEYAATRSLLEALPFVQGFGVDIALLIDVLDRAGLDGIAEVDLDRRIHDNKPLADLGSMAGEILATALARRDGDPGVPGIRERPPLRSWRSRRRSLPGRGTAPGG